MGVVPDGVGSSVRSTGAGGVRLLEADPDLGSGLSGDARDEALRHAVLPTIVLPAGPWTLADLGGADGAYGDIHGFMVLSGAVTLDADLAGRTSTRLIGPHELVLTENGESDSLPVAWAWTALGPAELAVLDERLLAIGRRWPALLSAILQRAAQQTHQAALQQAISQLPRVEDRLLALFWALADRLGVMRGDGVWLPVPTTHETLARMIGARRPTVSLGLSKLSEHGWVRGEPDGWLIDPESIRALGPPSPPDLDAAAD